MNCYIYLFLFLNPFWRIHLKDQTFISKKKFLWRGRNRLTDAIISFSLATFSWFLATNNCWNFFCLLNHFSKIFLSYSSNFSLVQFDRLQFYRLNMSSTWNQLEPMRLLLSWRVRASSPRSPPHGVDKPSLWLWTVVVKLWIRCRTMHHGYFL